MRASTTRQQAIEERCRTRGLALTVQRRTILEEFLGRRDHPTVDHIYEAVAPRLGGLSRATVYRVLETLVEVGAARKVFHPDAVARFDPVTERHHHLVCEACGTLTDLAERDETRLRLPPVGAGFRITDYSINFTGICSGCRKAARGSRKDDKKA